MHNSSSIKIKIKTTKHKISLPKTNYRVVLPQLNTLQLNNKRNEPKRTTRTLQTSFDTESGKQVLLDLERVTNTTRVTADHQIHTAIFVVAQQQLLKRIRNMTQLRTAKIEKDNIK